MNRWRILAWLVATFAVWELLGRLQWIAGRAFPPPSAILADWIGHYDVYLLHIAAIAIDGDGIERNRGQTQHRPGQGNGHSHFQRCEQERRRAEKADAKVEAPSRRVSRGSTRQDHFFD